MSPLIVIGVYTIIVSYAAARLLAPFFDIYASIWAAIFGILSVSACVCGAVFGVTMFILGLVGCTSLTDSAC